MIMELSGNRESEEYQHLVQLFALQLQLFYNILGCQENEVLDATKDLLARMLDEIISILQQFREREIQLPESFRAFLENWAEKVAGLNNNLV
jgi:hypothetical protein